MDIILVEIQVKTWVFTLEGRENLNLRFEIENSLKQILALFDKLSPVEFTVQYSGFF